MSERKHFDTPMEALRYHVTGAIERGEAEPIVAVEAEALCEACQHPIRRAFGNTWTHVLTPGRRHVIPNARPEGE